VWNPTDAVALASNVLGGGAVVLFGLTFTSKKLSQAAIRKKMAEIPIILYVTFFIIVMIYLVKR
jgi:hypothetical protein